ncbi:hypothetical protein [Sagittula salina]|uniref:Uncharacterized protein n=1 Tax=Sagittula salina TaxID=2820268 RepID=A0A940MMJ2_9RHOB|nr:hypothetical protein [Sagittula salina]MBP0481223.1 hypothetical protein [Sagittula salina]
MQSKLIDITVCGAMILGFTAGGVQSLTRTDMHNLGAYMITSVGFVCEDVVGMKPGGAEDVFDVSCTANRMKIAYTINARTGEVWRG